MENWLYANLEIVFKTLVSLILIFIVIIVITRVAGLRTFAKMSSFDFASTIAIGSILANVIMSSNQSLMKGAIALGGIIAFQALFSYLVRNSDKIKSIATNKPSLLMLNGEILYNNLSNSNIGEDDLIAKLREANVLDFDDVLAVVLESTGDVSVLHSKDRSLLSDKLLTGVDTKT